MDNLQLDRISKGPCCPFFGFSNLKFFLGVLSVYGSHF